MRSIFGGKVLDNINNSSNKNNCMFAFPLFVDIASFLLIHFQRGRKLSVIYKLIDRFDNRWKKPHDIVGNEVQFSSHSVFIYIKLKTSLARLKTRWRT